MINEDKEWYEKEKQKLMDIFKSMTKEQLINFIKDNLYFDEDFCVDEWKIYVDHLLR